jgi:predicted RNase H-like HicB family nuclease/REP element-mobilizing transposase RayT
VTCRGNARQDIFLVDPDRELFLDTLADTVERFGWICHVCCLMSNHCHLLVETPEPNLSRGMRYLNGVYTQAFNRRHLPAACVRGTHPGRPPHLHHEPGGRDPQPAAEERKGQAVPGEADTRCDPEVQSALGGLAMDSKYEIIIFWSHEDSAFVAEVPELPGCMADGETYQEALSNAEQIIREWVETAKELGRSVPQPKGRLAYA